ncbi:MAG: hypothetical protein A2Y81_09825 [Nitrospirae bacterium RBG_13_43_8]|nr:MAG: hypothetical protein A2Y81_09825 [Nitrospirae bacterium RBG_13_43_8]
MAAGYSGVLFITLFYTDSNAVIPAKLVREDSNRGAGIQNKKTGFRVKPGMTQGIPKALGIKLLKCHIRNDRSLLKSFRV